MPPHAPPPSRTAASKPSRTNRTDRRVQSERRRLLRAIDRLIEDPQPHCIDRFLAQSFSYDPYLVSVLLRRRFDEHGRQRPYLRRGLRRLRRELLGALRTHLRADWHYAWSDGSRMECESGAAAGLGGVVLDPRGETVCEISETRDGINPFDAERYALLAVLRAAAKEGVQRLVLNTDCRSLVQLVTERPADPRVRGIRRALERFEDVRLRVIPRRENRHADRLARRAARQGLAQLAA